MMRRSTIPFMLVSGLIGAAIFAGLSEWRKGEQIRSAPVYEGALRVIDGDSIVVGGVETRLLGIDAPELYQSCARGDEPIPCGREAKRYMETLAATGAVSCRSTGRDRYGRTLGVCSTPKVADINAAMVRDGWAVAYGGYEAEEVEARDAKRGIWAYRFDRPQEWRRAHPRRN